MKKLFLIFTLLSFSFTLNAQWVQMSNGMGTKFRIYSLGYCRNNIVAGAQNTINSATYTYVSSNNGVNWLQTTFTKVANCYITNDTFLLAGTSSGVYRSNDFGMNWSYYSISDKSISDFAKIGTTLFAAIGSFVYKSTNVGFTWSPSSDFNRFTRCLSVSGNELYSGTEVVSGNGGIYKSTNFGQNWTNSLNNAKVISIATNGPNIYAALIYVTGSIGRGVYLSTNSGQNWSPTSLNYLDIFTLAISGSNVIAGSDSGIFVTTNNGTTWAKKNQGFDTIPSINNLLIKNEFVFAGTWGKSVWRRSLSEIIGVQNISSKVPSAFSLKQNYPNPFNPSTSIEFDILTESDVLLKIFDVSGKEITTLVNEKLDEGSYIAEWNVGNYPSGIYFYTLSAENFSQTKKMILIK
ncbi:MAG: T9SS type A sorting domain-containing protein [Ignavibacteriae bacterium]|nr:T9SS type A sorting domain-containing protein [Ignavibacteriota bacterium]